MLFQNLIEYVLGLMPYFRVIPMLVSGLEEPGIGCLSSDQDKIDTDRGDPMSSGHSEQARPLLFWNHSPGTIMNEHVFSPRDMSSHPLRLMVAHPLTGGTLFLSCSGASRSPLTRFS